MVSLAVAATSFFLFVLLVIIWRVKRDCSIVLFWIVVVLLLLHHSEKINTLTLNTIHKPELKKTIHNPKNRSWKIWLMEGCFLVKGQRMLFSNKEQVRAMKGCLGQWMLCSNKGEIRVMEGSSWRVCIWININKITWQDLYKLYWCWFPL